MTDPNPLIIDTDRVNALILATDYDVRAEIAEQCSPDELEAAMYAAEIADQAMNDPAIDPGRVAELVAADDDDARAEVAERCSLLEIDAAWQLAAAEVQRQTEMADARREMRVLVGPNLVAYEGLPVADLVADAYAYCGAYGVEVERIAAVAYPGGDVEVLDL